MRQTRQACPEHERILYSFRFRILKLLSTFTLLNVKQSRSCINVCHYSASCMLQFLSESYELSVNASRSGQPHSTLQHKSAPPMIWKLSQAGLSCHMTQFSALTQTASSCSCKVRTSRCSKAFKLEVHRHWLTVIQKVLRMHERTPGIVAADAHLLPNSYVGVQHWRQFVWMLRTVHFIR